MTRILILGSGAREKVIREKLRCDAFILDSTDFDEIKSFVISESITLVIPSTEWYLCKGIKDFLESSVPGVRVFGPDKYQAQIEGSKLFSKILMTNLKIPTAPYYYVKTPDHFWVTEPLENIVVKYCGLANGKGVYLPRQSDSIRDILTDLQKFGNEGFIVENRYHGPEVSVMAFCNGKESFLMPQARDYKNIYDGNKGPNTGGMGSVCPLQELSDSETQIVKKHIDNVVCELGYTGILYAGVIKTEDGPFFLEFNCRFGDPEAQSILNLLESDLKEVILDCMDGRTPNIVWNDLKCITVVLSHNLYPEKRLTTPVKIETQSKLDPSIKTYKSNVTTDSEGLEYTTGGRVMSLTCVDTTHEQARRNVYANIDKIQYDGVYYRKDIGNI